MVGNWIHDNGTHSNLDHGVYWSSGTGGLLANNLIECSQAYGVQMYPAPSGQTITHNTVVASGQSRAGILLNTTGSAIAVVNNISAFNTGPGIRVSGSGCIGCFADQNLLYGNSVDYDGSGITIYRTICLDPRFANRGAGNYHLLSGSPAVDVARADYSLASDLDGRAGPQGPAPDLGRARALNRRDIHRARQIPQKGEGRKADEGWVKLRQACFTTPADAPTVR